MKSCFLPQNLEFLDFISEISIKKGSYFLELSYTPYPPPFHRDLLKDLFNNQEIVTNALVNANENLDYYTQSDR